MKNIKLSIVIPVYNSQGTLEDVLNQTTEYLGKVSWVDALEFILVNDGSKDASAAVCEKLAEQKNVCYINFTKNFGQHHALLCGYKEATGDVVVKMDDDLQTRPEDVPALVQALLNADADVVFARFTNSAGSFIRRWGTRLNNKMATVLLGKPKEITVSGFYAMREYVVKNIVTYTNPYPYIAGLIFRVTDNIINVDLTQGIRGAGTSNYTLKKLMRLWVNGFVNFSVKPLRLASVLGSCLSLVGFIFLIILFVRRLMDATTQLGWTSTIAAIVFFGGIQLLSLGLIGEYVGRIFISINHFPQYVVKGKKDGRN